MTILFAVLAGIVSFIIGGLWYGLIFRQAWLKAVGLSPSQIEAAGNGQKEMFATALIEIVTACLTIVFLNALTINPISSAAIIGLLSVLSALKNYLFERRPINLILINEGYKWICFLVAGIFASLI
ncbi:DUF1761 domain-containing protein [Streptococcus ferus]|uniref:DUF1761 domain-containing protein n=1 Tax=Streptococcus ferus TaxID=1345 RepID=UPI00359F6E12